MSNIKNLSIEDLARAVALSCQGALAPSERDALLEILAERQAALAQQAGDTLAELHTAHEYAHNKVTGTFDEWWADNINLRLQGASFVVARAAWCAALAQQAPATIPVGMDANGDVVEVPNPLAQQAQPDYRCVMCNKPLPVGCKDCTEYAYDAVGYPVAAPQSEPEDARRQALVNLTNADSWQPEDAPESVYHELMVANGEVERLSLEVAALRAVSQPTTREQIADAIVKLALRGTSEAKP